ncbi:hypothetical protein F5884DRAFT_351414 [Xylogone sp. PMI_703]|nr:hypothetical protein F5884DRAFT_351414 [Xylogone sp. PMI_703]
MSSPTDEHAMASDTDIPTEIYTSHHERSHLPHGLSSEEPSTESSAVQSGAVTPANAPPRRGRVRFNSKSEAHDASNERLSFPVYDQPQPAATIAAPSRALTSPSHSRSSSLGSVFRTGPDTASSPSNEEGNPFADPAPARTRRPIHSVLRKDSQAFLDAADEDISVDTEKKYSAKAAQERAQRVASSLSLPSDPRSRRPSVSSDADVDDDDDLPPRRTSGYPVRIDDIPLVDLPGKSEGPLGSDAEEDRSPPTQYRKTRSKSTAEAHKLVREHTRKDKSARLTIPAGPPPGLVSGQVTPTEERADAEEYVPRPEKYRGGILSTLLSLYTAPQGLASKAPHGGSGSHTGSPSQPTTPGSSGTTTPLRPKWYQQHSRTQSSDAVTGLLEASSVLSTPAGGFRPPARPTLGKRSYSANLIDATMGKISGRPRLEDEIRITVHIAETLSRQKYLLKLCRALMSYGAPTHRLEEYMKMSARVLEIDGQFLYIPGCMIISFDDATTHTTEVKIVKSMQGVDLGKLKDVHQIYKEVVHDVIGVEEATQRLDEIIRKPKKYKPWVLVMVYGFASAAVAPFAFQGRLIDLPIAWFLGCCLGFLQLILAPKSELYSNVFEISAAVLTSFLARAFGSIRNGEIFCFSALAQSSIALILPGYIVLCGSLELQSRSMVAGSVRMVYAIIYSLFLGFGITVGTAIYGVLDKNATNATTCRAPIGEYWRWLFVPPFALCLAIINQAKWKQTPMMLLISFIGYVVNFFSTKAFPSSAQISNTLGALAIGVVGNLYSRLRHGVAAAALLPAIFVQVPSGLAASGSLLSGLNTADLITNRTHNGTSIGGTSSVAVSSPEDLNTIVFNVAYSMIQVAIGITVGLFLSALIIYPFGKRRSGLFSF